MEEYHQITINEWMDAKARLKRAALNAANGFVELGHELRVIEENELYRAGGYQSIAEFADSEPEFGLSASMVSRLININKQFADPDDPKRLRLEFARMGMSKLSEMLTIPMDDRDMIRPETKRDDIRELKRLEKEPEAESDLEKVVRMFFDDFPAVLDELRSSRAYTEGNTSGMVEIVNPSGSRSYRKSGMMLMMYEDSIKYKAAGHKPETVRWSEFFGIADRIEVEEDENGADGRNKGDIGDHGRISGGNSGSDTEVFGNGGEDCESDQGSDIEDQRGVPGDDGLADRSEKEPDTDPEEREPSDDSHNDEDAGSGHDDRKERGDEEAGQLEKGGDEEPYGDAEAEPVAEGPEEAAAGGMNLPVEEEEPVAPAQLAEKIVDETGQPAPEETSVEDIKETWQRRKEAGIISSRINREISMHDWRAAMTDAKDLMRVLRWLMEHDG